MISLRITFLEKNMIPIKVYLVCNCNSVTSSNTSNLSGRGLEISFLVLSLSSTSSSWWSWWKRPCLNQAACTPARSQTMDAALLLAPSRDCKTFYCKEITEDELLTIWLIEKDFISSSIARAWKLTEQNNFNTCGSCELVSCCTCKSHKALSCCFPV